MSLEPKEDQQSAGNTSRSGIGIALGVGVGVAIGNAMGNLGAGIAIGIAIGIAVATGLQRKGESGENDQD